MLPLRILFALAVAVSSCRSSDVRLPQTAPPGSQQALSAIEQLEYRARRTELGLQAPNRRHGFRTWFHTSGIRVVDRVPSAAGSQFELRLARLGREAQRDPVAAGEVHAAGERIEIRRPGIVEWYVNSAAGLEQGFSVDQRPAGAGELVLELAVEGARVQQSGEALELRAENGRTFGYGALWVKDAAGREVPARLASSAPDRIEIRVADAGASYPLTIDPLLTSIADAVLGSGQDSSVFGATVSGAGDVNGDGYDEILIGAWAYDNGEGDEGAVFLYYGSGSGSSGAGGVSIIESDQGGALLGWAVGAAGDVNGDGYDDIVMAARQYDAGQPDEGAAFIFHGGPGGIPSSSVSAAATRIEGDIGMLLMGQSVSGIGDVNGDGYGDVAIAADLYESSLLQQDEGAVFVFLGRASGIPTGGLSSAAARLESDQTGARFGDAIAGAGDVNGDGYADLLVGAFLYDQGESDEGAAYVYLGGPAGITSGSPATASAVLQSNQAGAQLGFSVAGLGDVNGDGYGDVALGAPYYDAIGADSGEIYVFHGSSTGITSGGPPQAAGRIARIQGNERVGWAIAGIGDVDGDGYADLAVGSPLTASISTGVQGGTAAVLFGSATGIQTTGASGFSALFANEFGGPHAGAQLGYSVGGADVNGDGHADLVVGIPNAIPTGSIAEGLAYVMHGSGGLGNARPGGSGGAGQLLVASTLQANQGGAEFGYSVRAAGDVNGDGYADAIVGAPFFDAGDTDEGAAFVFYGNPSGLGDSPGGLAPAELQGNQGGAQFGFATAGAGDVNGDGYGDIIVGAPTWDSPNRDQGGAFIFLGSAEGIDDGSPATAATRLEGTGNLDALFGDSVSAAGDVNGDGYGDVIIGEPGYASVTSRNGQAYVFHGGPTGIPDQDWSQAQSVLQNDQQLAWFGISVAGAGDVNRDGYSDVIVGSYLYDSGQIDEGAAFVYHGSSSGIPTGFTEVAAARLLGEFQSTEFGTSVAGAGDVNGDGYSDVIVGGWRGRLGFSVGVAGVFHGGPTGVGSRGFSAANTRLFPGDDDTDDQRFGIAVTSAGDYDGDGYSDVIVAGHQMLPFASTGAVRTGMAAVLLGGPLGIPTGFVGNDNTTLHSPIWPQFALYGRSGQFDWLGVGIAGLGDVNGDGFSDVGVGAPLAEEGQGDEGLVYLALGGRGQAGRPVRLRQVESIGGSPIAPLGRSDAGDRFGVRMLGTHPEGRGLVRLEVETCPKTSPFGAASCTRQLSPSWVEASASGTELALTPSGLLPDRLYRWRARVLQAPLSLLKPGISAPPAPGHGPWRRFLAQAFDGDLRASATPPGGSGDPATLYFQAVATPATATCPAPCFEIRMFLESTDRDLEVQGVEVDVDVVGSATVAALPVPPAINANAERATTILELPDGNFLTAPWDLTSLVAASALPGFDAVAVGASSEPYSVAEIHAIRASYDICTPGKRCAIQLAGLGASRIYLGRFNLTWNGGPVGARVGGIQGVGPMVVGSGVGIARLDGATFPIDGFPAFDDPDGDGVLGAADNCPYFASAITTDTDGDGRGDPCECTDQNGDGRNTVADLVAINLAIFSPGLATALCDGNDDGQCNVADIVAANIEIFSPTSTSICARYPVAGP
jgi:hypothetical protein